MLCDRKSEKVDDDVVYSRGMGIERIPEEIQQEEKRAVAGEFNMSESCSAKREDPGCRALLTGTSRQKHTIQCRSRMEEGMGSDGRVKAARRRREDFLDQVIVRPGHRGGEPGEDDGKAEIQEGERGEDKADDGVRVDEQADGVQSASGSGLGPRERKRRHQEAEEQESAERVQRRPGVQEKP